nr:hypothetical protein ORM20_00070 [Ochrobactrum phage ORM_20]
MKDFYKIFGATEQPIWVIEEIHKEKSNRRLVSSLQPLGRVDGVPRFSINFERKGNEEFTSFKDYVNVFLVNDQLNLEEVLHRTKVGEFTGDSIVVAMNATAINSFRASTHDIVEYAVDFIWYNDVMDFSTPLHYRKSKTVKEKLNVG